MQLKTYQCHSLNKELPLCDRPRQPKS